MRDEAVVVEVFDNGHPVLEDAERYIRDARAKVGEPTVERDFLARALGCFGLPSAKRRSTGKALTITRKRGIRDRPAPRWLRRRGELR